MYLKNIFYMTPEIYMSLAIVTLLAYGVIYSKKDGIVSGLKNITHLSILILSFVIWLVNILETSPKLIKIGDGILGEGGGLSQIIIKSIVLISGIIILWMSLSIYEKKEDKLIDYEYSQLILLSILGMLLLISSRDLIVMYLSIETMSLSLYVLAAIRRTGQYSTEAGLKYFILGALSSGMLLFGAALIYITTGLTEWESISNYVWLAPHNTEVGTIGLLGSAQRGLWGVELGSMFILLALLFKLGAAPLHMWLPDVYEGAPTIVTAFFSIVPKIAILSFLISLVYGPLLGIFENLVQPIFILSGLLSIFIGSIAAINQTKIKRLLAYSAIAHMGWILLGLGIGTLLSIQAALIYIILYIVMTINSFSFVLSYYDKGFGNHYITQLSGLSRKEPVLAITFSLCLLSIAGIPPLAGFFSKYNILLALIDENYIIVSILGIVVSVIGSFYYIRIIQWMYFNNSSDYIWKDLGDIVYNEKKEKVGFIKSILLGSTLYIILTYLIYPNPLLVLTFDGISSIIL